MADGLPKDRARKILGLGFPDEVQARMHQLAVKNQESQLTAEETEELDNCIKAGDLLAILQSKARKSL